jgi:hypothetical protein
MTKFNFLFKIYSVAYEYKSECVSFATATVK